MKKIIVILSILFILPVTITQAAPRVRMCDPTVSVPDNLSAAVAEALRVDPPADTPDYAITHYGIRGDSYLVSVVGIPTEFDCTGWNWMQDGVWRGLVAVRDITTQGRGLSSAPAAKSLGPYQIGAVQGRDGFDQIIDGMVDLDDEAKSNLKKQGRSPNQFGAVSHLLGGILKSVLPLPQSVQNQSGGSSDFWFPWEVGKKMMIGTYGIHGTGGWYALDFFSGDDYGGDAARPYVYGVTDATITSVCEDDYNVGFIAQTTGEGGNLNYIHLQKGNSAITSGAAISRGSYIGALIYGTFPQTATCNYYASQLENHYHLHLGFYPSNNKFMIEDWVLDVTSATFSRGDETRTTGQWLTAEWSGGSAYIPPYYPISPTPIPGAPCVNCHVPPDTTTWSGDFFFDNLLGGLIEIVDAARESYPVSDSEIGLATTLERGVAIGARIMFVMVRSTLNLTVTIITISIIVVIEGLYIIYKLWIRIKDAIPFIG